MQFFDLDKYGNEWATAFKADFFVDYMAKWSTVDPTSNMTSAEDIEFHKTQAKSLSYYTKNGEMSLWQNSFAEFFSDKYKEIEGDLKEFLNADEGLQNQLKSKGYAIEDVMQLQDVSVYEDEQNGIDFSFTSYLHENYLFALKWKTNKSVNYTEIVE